MALLSEHLLKDEIKKTLTKKIIGQDQAVDAFLSGMLRNLFSVLEMLSNKEKKYTLKRLSIFFISGPTGSGKTFMVREVCDLLDIPFIEIDISTITPTGYKGAELRDILSKKVKGIERISEIPVEMVSKYKVLKKVVFLSKIVDKNFLVDLIKFGSLWVFFPKENDLDSFLDIFDLDELDREKFKKISNLLENFRKEIFPDEAGKKVTNTNVGIVVVFFDEFDKLFSGDSHEFYSKVQEQLLKIIEDPVIFKDANLLKSFLYPIFVLAGSFWNADLGSVIPEMKGRIDYEIKLNKLTKDDYRIIARQKLSTEYFNESFWGVLEVEIDDSFYDAIAELCDRLNSKEYLGARRLSRIFKTIERAILNEYFSSSESVIKLNGNFVHLVFDDTLDFYSNLSKEIQENTFDKSSFEEACKRFSFDVMCQYFLEILKQNENKLFINEEKLIEKLFIYSSQGKPLIYEIIKKINVNGKNQKLSLVVNNSQLEIELRKKLEDFQTRFPSFSKRLSVEESEDFVIDIDSFSLREAEEEADFYSIEDFFFDFDSDSED